MNITSEEWRSVPYCGGRYEVSNQGRVRTLTREVAMHLLKGYPTVHIGMRTVSVHKLVCEAWHGSRPEGMQCRHLDGNPLNCSPENLQWGTPRENTQDIIRHGRHANKLKTHCPSGHEYSDENTYLWKNRRACRVCNRAAVARSKARRLAVAA